MTFINPTIEEIYQIISGNEELINYLKDKQFLITNEMLYDSYTPEEIKEMEPAIKAENIEMLYNLSNVLLEYSDEIKSKEIWVLSSNRIAFKEIAGAFGLEEEDFTLDAYRQIIYTYKFCYISSFFQNNKKTFIPEYDFNFIEDTPVLKAFIDAMSKEFDKLDTIIGKCLEYKDFDKIPYDLINYLTQLLGFEKATINADDEMEEKFREIAKNILDVYRIKGTNFSFELLFKFIGYNIQIKEFYFDRRLFYTSGNIHTNVTDNKNFLFYMSVDSPASNKVDASVNELVSLSDFTQQYNLDEFTRLANEYGPEAVLGYSPLDKNGKEYTGKVYKYFKTNLVYYIISLDKANPTDKQLFQINKILDFLIPAYIMKTTNIEVYTGSNNNSPSDNMIFFDDIGRDPDDGNNTLINLEAESGSSEEDYDYIRNKIRNKYPLMLDSELRDDFNFFGTDKSNYIIEGSNPPKIMHDNGEQGDYLNTIGTTNFKPKVPVSLKGRISLNRYVSNSNGIEFFNFLNIKNEVKNNEAFENVEVTDKPIEEYLSENRKFNYTSSLIQTLTKITTVDYSNEEEKKEVKETLTNTYDFCLEIEKNLGSMANAPMYIAPVTLDEVSKLIYNKFVLIDSGTFFAVYRYGSILKETNTTSASNYSFEIKLLKLQRLYRSIGRTVDITVPDGKGKINGANLEIIYNIATGKTPLDNGHALTPSEALNYYYHDESENEWYFPIKKARLGDYKVTTGKTYYYKISSIFLPDLPDSKKIPVVFKTRDGKYCRSTTALNVEKYDTVEDYFNAEYFPEGEGIYNNFCFFINEDDDDKYASDLYIYKSYFDNNLVFSTVDGKFYLLNGEEVTELPNFFGRLEIDDGKLYEYDDSWTGWNEIDDCDNFIFYNNEHKVDWDYINLHQVIGRPIKYLTDKEVEEGFIDIEKTIELKKLLLNEVFYSTFQHFSLTDKTNIYSEEGVDDYESLINKIKTGLTEETKEYVREKAEYPYEDGFYKDDYGNYFNNFGLFYDLIAADNYLDFLKEYYYNKLLRLYRESYIKDLQDQNDFCFSIKDFERVATYEKLNGNMGKLGKPNNLLQSYVNDKPLMVPYTYSETTVGEETNGVLKVSTDELYKANLIENLIESKISNIRVVCGTISDLFIKYPKYKYVETGLEIEYTLPQNMSEEEGGYLEINNTPQLLSDNKINKHNSEYLIENTYDEEGRPINIDHNEDEFVTNGDDRLINVVGNFTDGLPIKIVEVDGEIGIVIEQTTTLGQPPIDFSDLDYITIEFDYDKKRTDFNRFISIASVGAKNVGVSKDIKFNDVENNFSTNLSGLIVVKK